MKTPRTVTRVSTVPSLYALALALTTGLVARAGDLNPPAGPVAPTMKTLVEVEPRTAIDATNTPGGSFSVFRITEPGSYYLTGNLTGESGKHGIEIAASGVTLDLNGFDLLGVPGSFDGVNAPPPDPNPLLSIAVMSGSVRNWGGNGVGLDFVRGCRLVDLIADGNGGTGLAAGEASGLFNCSATSNTSYGISAGLGSNLAHCSAGGNASGGIVLQGAGSMTRCAAYNNTGGHGIFSDAGSTLADCTAFFNTVGFKTDGTCTLQNCVSYFNTSHGFAGFNQGGSIWSRCTAYGNSGNGIAASTLGWGGVVEECTVIRSWLDGIVCDSDCVIRGNQLTYNGANGDGAGIRVTGSSNRLEGNTCAGADRGIHVPTTGNFIVRNICKGNTIANWDVEAGNVCLVVQAAVTGGAILGDSGGTAPGSTDPNANFTY